MARLHLTSRHAQRRGSLRSIQVSLLRVSFGFLCLALLGWIVYYPRLLLSYEISSLPAGKRDNQSQQYVRYNKRGKLVMHRIDRVRLEDLHDLTDDYLLRLRNSRLPISFEQASKGKRILLDELYRSGVKDLDVESIQLLPTWQEVTKLYYPHLKDGEANGNSAVCEPIIYGLDKCRAFAQRHTSARSFLATAGLYNTGTNALTYTLRANLRMAGNPLFDGILVQAPWHKHWFVSQRHSHVIPYLSNITLDNVLPVVTIRDPLSWAQSMCEQPYDVEWTDTSNNHKAPPQCPSILHNEASVYVPKQTGEKRYANLFDLWNTWYRAYLDSIDLDFVMVRHEDLIYCPRQVVSALQACSGAAWSTQDRGFVYVMDQAKWEHKRLSGKAQSNRVSAMIKHGHALGRRIRHISAEDISQIRLNETLMNMFGYQMPNPSILIQP